MASSRLSQPLFRGVTDADYGPRALRGVQIDEDDGDLSDADDCRVDGPPEPPRLEDLYELDWNEPEGHTAMKLEDFVKAARAANADTQKCTFVVIHLFSGRRRKHDLEHWMRVMCSSWLNFAHDLGRPGMGPALGLELAGHLSCAHVFGARGLHRCALRWTSLCHLVSTPFQTWRPSAASASRTGVLGSDRASTPFFARAAQRQCAHAEHVVALGGPGESWRLGGYGAP